MTARPGDQCWQSGDNNLILNSVKTNEIVFVDRRRMRQHQPPLMSDIARVSSMKILSVTWTTGMSASDHVQFNSTKLIHSGRHVDHVDRVATITDTIDRLIDICCVTNCAVIILIVYYSQLSLHLKTIILCLEVTTELCQNTLGI